MNTDYIKYYEFDEDIILDDDESQIFVPGFCPQCNKSGKQKIIFAFKTQGENDKYYGIMLTLCYSCLSTTIHFLDAKSDANDYWSYTPSESIPRAIEDINLSDYILKTFPDFSKIFEQSTIAEEQNLNLIAGMGYRKAVEFLVSDYLIQFPQLSGDVSTDWVRNPKTTFNQKIEKISDKRIKTVSRAISWIGNDETHYTRRHEDKDINSMKIFIKTLLALIEYDKNVSEAEAFISNDKD